MSYTQGYIEGKDANNLNVKFPVLSDGTPTGLKLPMNTPAGAFPTFRATNVLTNNLPASSVDWLQIKGSSSKTVFVTKILITALPGAATPETVTVGLARRTATYAAGMGGTLDDLLAAGSPPLGASPAYAAGNTPTAGITTPQTTAATASATGGFIGVKLLPFVGIAGAPTTIGWDFGAAGGQPLILSGTSDFVVLTFGGPVTPQTQVDVEIEWYEV